MRTSGDHLDLMHRYFTGAADAESVRLLGEHLKADPLLRRDFLAYARIDAALAAMPAPEVSRRNSSRWRSWVPLAAAGLAVAAFLAWKMPMDWRPRPWATLVSSTNAEWADPNVDLMLRGGELPGGLLRLTGGEVELETSAGARVLLQAPVAVRFLSEKRLVCEEGRVVCDCPTPRSRLTVETAQTTVVDLGTVFSVEAQPDASTLISVLSGEVELRGGDPRRVRQGEVAVVRSSVVRVTPMSDAESARFATMLATPRQSPPALPNLTS
jgi:ferric-dicitrate binding protein FerR (iron transport regulator)